MSDRDPFLEEFYESQREELRDELAQLNHEIDAFWEQEDADEMEDTYGDLIERRDQVRSQLRELE